MGVIRAARLPSVVIPERTAAGGTHPGPTWRRAPSAVAAAGGSRIRRAGGASVRDDDKKGERMASLSSAV